MQYHIICYFFKVAAPGAASGSPTFEDNQATGGDGGAIAIGPVSGTADMQIVTGAVETVRSSTVSFEK